jgi:hypothetical protein
MTCDIEEAARLWQAILRTDTGTLFGETYAPRLLNRPHGFDQIAQPGYIGAEYSGRLVFVSMNPGNGVDGLSEDDLEQYPALERLRDAGPHELVSVFQQLNNILAEITPHWKIYKKLVAPILSGAGIPVSQIAYLTLLQWRTEKSNGLRPLYDRCWKAHTQAQMDLLKPRMIILLGKSAGRAFRSYIDAASTSNVHIIPRGIGDAYVPQEGQMAIKGIVAELLKATG